MLYSQTLFTIAEDYKNRGFYLLAIDIIKEVIKFCSDQVIIKNMKITLADCLRIIKRWDEAIEVYKDNNDLGAIGNIFFYLGKYDEAIKWYELVRKRKYYVYYKYPHALFLIGQYFEALDLICEKHYVETKNSLIENNFPTKTELEFILLSFEKAYNFHQNVIPHRENSSQIEIINYLDSIILNHNEKSYEKHQGLVEVSNKRFWEFTNYSC